LLSIINGLLIYFLISYLLGMLGFWYMTIWHFKRLLEDTIRVFAGALIPLWFFPQFLVTVSNYLPFKYIYFIPISIYLQKISLAEAQKAIALQFIWLVTLLALEHFVWQKAIKKLVIQGG